MKQGGKPKTQAMSLTPFAPDSKQSNKTPKSKRSPFLVDLVAESERIDEEYKVKIRSVERKRQVSIQRKEQAKNEIILRALQEPNELEELRKEKKKILEEEKRLKALIELEKTNGRSRKNDRKAAEIAEKRRHAAKLEKRRSANKEEIVKREEARIKMIQIKHNLKPK